MKNYTITSTDSKQFTLADGDKVLGKLVYESWFSFKADITLADQSSFQVEPKGFWGTTIQVKRHNEVVADFRMNWKGQILLHNFLDGADDFYILKQKGFLKSGYVLSTDKEDELMCFLPKFKWTKARFDHQVESSNTFETLAHKDFLLLVGTHCINYFIAVVAAAS